MNTTNIVSNNKSIKYGVIIFAFVVAANWSSALAEIIPSNRLITWQGNVGVPGGIPNRTTNCTSAACNTLYGGTVTTASINAAITSAGTDQVVRIPAGTYTLTSSITLKHRTVLRGAGMGITNISVNNGSAVIVTPAWNFRDESKAITSGTTKGSTSFVASDVSNISAGVMLAISQDNESFMWSRGSDTHLLTQIVKVESVVGNTVTYSPALVWDFVNNPVYAKHNMYWLNSPYQSYMGIEDMTLDATGGGNEAVQFYDTYYSWIKGVEIKNINYYGILMIATLQCTISNCYFHDAKSFTENVQEGHGVYMGRYKHSVNSYNLIEDNVFKNLWIAVMGNANTGCTIAYNYSHNNAIYIWPTNQVQVYNAQHGAHCMMNLWEGNVGQQWQNDGYHGSGSHETLFRNLFDGVSGISGVVDNRKMVDLTRFSRYHNIIGNVLGDSSWTPSSYEMTGQPNYKTQPTIYRLGYPNMGNNSYTPGGPPQGTTDPDTGAGIDPIVKTTLFRHMNYDYYTSSIKHCDDSGEPGCQGGDGSRILPNSLYLASKPSFFGSCTWPPFGPDLSPMVNTLPAKARYEGSSVCTGHLVPPTNLQIRNTP